MAENNAQMNQQGKDKEKELVKEDDYYSKVNEVNESINGFTKLRIWISSYKNMAITYLIIAYLIPIFILALTLFIEGASESLIDYLNSTEVYASPITSQEAFMMLASVMGTYLYYVDSGWLIDILSFGYLDIKYQFGYFKEMGETVFNLNSNQAIFLTLIVVTIVHFLFNFLFWLILSWLTISKPMWKGKSDNLEYYSQKLQKALGEATNLRDSKIKKEAMADVKKYKKKLMDELKKAKNSNDEVNDYSKLIQILPAYKIAINNKDSILGNQIAGLANKKWEIHVKQQTTIENSHELHGFLFEYQFNKPQMAIIFGLNWLHNREDVFPSNEKEDKLFFENLKKDPKAELEYKYTMLRIFMIIKFFKNYPHNSPIRFLKEKKDIEFDKRQLLIVTNAKKIIMNMKNEPRKILDLPLDLTLPDIKDEIKKKDLIREYSDFIGNNNKEIALLENEAESEVIWEPDTRFKIMMKDYKEKYKKILNFFVKTIFENYNHEQSENFEENIKKVFEDFFETSDADPALVQIAKFKVIKLEDFYDMLEWVMKTETIYGEDIQPLYKEYYKKLKIQEILYNKN